MRPHAPKSHAELIHGWDRLARERQRQIASGEDLSFCHVIVPMALTLLEGCDKRVVLDVGSGTGEFTARLAKLAGRVIAVEPSGVSNSYARENCRAHGNVQILESYVEDSVEELSDLAITSAVAVMSLMTAPSVDDVARTLSTILPPKARVVAILTHPCFWPRYWGYDQAAWFDYEKETFIEAPFVTSKCKTNVLTTHIHRPLETYCSIFAANGFVLETVSEPIPDEKIQKLYPAAWRFPRFIGLKWMRRGRVSNS